MLKHTCTLTVSGTHMHAYMQVHSAYLNTHKYVHTSYLTLTNAHALTISDTKMHMH